MNIYGLIRQEHDLQRDLAARLLRTPPDGPERLRLWKACQTEVAAHARAEAQTFYAALRAHPEGRDIARHGARAHAQADALIAELSRTAPATPKWLRTFGELAETLTQHMAEEEDVVFEAALRLLDELEEARLVRRYRAAKSVAPVPTRRVAKARNHATA